MRTLIHTIVMTTAAAAALTVGGCGDDYFFPDTDTGKILKPVTHCDTLYIETPEDLADLARRVNGGEVFQCYVVILKNDINFSGYDYGYGFNNSASLSKHNNGGSGWIPIGTRANPFNWVFEGNNFAINGLYINAPDLEDVGLFGVVMDGTVKSVYLWNADITGGANIGGVVGYLGAGGRVENCLFSGTLKTGPDPSEGDSEDPLLTANSVRGASTPNTVDFLNEGNRAPGNIVGRNDGGVIIEWSVAGRR